MKKIYLLLTRALLALMVLAACSKDEQPAPPPPPPPPPPPASEALKDNADFPIGVAIAYQPMLSDPSYANIVRRDFDEVVYENEMKHASMVQADGSLSFTRTNEMAATHAGIALHGHTLAWHAGQNAAYLKSYAGITGTSGPELLANPGFEDGLNGWTTFNSGVPEGSATIMRGTGAAETRNGAGSLKVINPVAYPGSQWRVQIASVVIATVPGRAYQFSYWVKALNAGGSARLSTQSNAGAAAQYQADQNIGTAWQLITWVVTANATETRFFFDLGQVANTYFIDDASCQQIATNQHPPTAAARLDEALKTYIEGMGAAFKGKARSWDVVNELFADNGAIRNHGNTPNSAPDVLVWSHYLGRAYAYKAFEYAQRADPDAALYINDYGLEHNGPKLDSLIAFVAELKARGLKVDGIGTQMHIAWNINRISLDNMMKKLAATGLKIRISELDISLQQSVAGMPTTTQLNNQASAVYDVVMSYFKHIPKAQRAGITMWGVVDKYSWLYNGGMDHPLLYGNDYQKKPAYQSFLRALRDGSK